MGYNTGVIVLNDALGTIKDHADEFVSQLTTHETPVDISVGGHVNAATVFHVAHADVLGVYAIGGNYVSPLLQTHYGNRGHHKPEDQVEVLKMVADKLGYRVVKKRK